MIQLTFDDYIEINQNILHTFNFVETNNKYEMLTHTLNGSKGIVKNSFDLKLNKREILKIVSESEKFKKHSYCWIACLNIKNRYYEILIRFGNNTTRSLSVTGYINNYFDDKNKDKLY